ncbi:GNAT family N-acetyltransferase [Streptococcus cameli]
MAINEYMQEIGESLPDYQPGLQPNINELDGKTVRIEKLSKKHVEDLYQAYGPTSHHKNWTYLPLNRFEDENSFATYIEGISHSTDPYYLAIIDKTSNKAVGTFALLRTQPQHRVIEIGWVIFSETLQKTRQGTEAHFLIMRYVFETLCYRRYEWINLIGTEKIIKTWKGGMNLVFIFMLFRHSFCG